MTRRLSRVGVLSVVTAVVAAGLAFPAAAAPTGTIVSAGSDAIAGSYIVVLADSTVASDGVAAMAGRLAASHHGSVDHVYQASLKGFATRMAEADARRLAADPSVAYVQEDQTVRLAGVQPDPPSWGLDRVDDRALPLDDSYEYPTTASNVHAYIIDTGVRITHDTFDGRAVSGRDTVNDDNDANDCNGHGTHVAGTIGGRQYGIAKGAQLVAVRVLNCAGSGTTSNIVAGIDWVTANAIKPAVANMSLGGSKNEALDDAVRGSIASGITYSIAAGNGSLFFGTPQKACNKSPAGVVEAITVAATNITDRRASFSNYGTCVDIFAPGVDITSAWNGSDTDTDTISGTSMSAPHVAGAAALYLSVHPDASPAEVRNRLVAGSTKGVVIDPKEGSPNRLLYVPATIG